MASWSTGLEPARLALRRLDDDGDARADRLRGEGEGRLHSGAGGVEPGVMSVEFRVEGRPDGSPPMLRVGDTSSPLGDEVDPLGAVRLRASEPLRPVVEAGLVGGAAATLSWDPARLRATVEGLGWGESYEVRLTPFRDLAGHDGPTPGIRLRTMELGALRTSPLGFEPGEALEGYRVVAGEPEIVGANALPVPGGDAALLLRPGDRVRVSFAVPARGGTLRARTRRLVSADGDPNPRPHLAGFTAPLAPGRYVQLRPPRDDSAGFLRVDTEDPRWPTGLGVREWSAELGSDYDADEVVLEVSVPRRCDASDADAVLLDDVRVE